MTIKKNIDVKIEAKTRKIFFDDNFLGISGENLQGYVVFSFLDEFVNGEANVEVEVNNEKYVITEVEREDESYKMLIKSSLLQGKEVKMQLVITETGEEGSIPVFKSKEFSLLVAEAINAEIEIPEEYESWIVKANEKLAEMENIDVSVSKEGKVATISTTNAKGITTTAEVIDGEDGKDGKDGIDGKDAKINGVNTLNIVAGENVILNQSGSTLSIDSKMYDDTDVQQSIASLEYLTEEQELDIANLDNRTHALEETAASHGSEISHLKTSKQDKLTAGANITIENNVISSTGGGGTADYSELSNKPHINDIELNGSLTSHELGLIEEDDVTTIMNVAKYNYVKDGLVNNTNTLSDSEKLKVETWLGLDENYLTYYNNTPYQVNNDYVPAHKKYVDGEAAKLEGKIEELQLFKFPNMTIVGTPTINNGQISDFTMEDYMEFPFLVDFRNRPFEINFAFTTGSNVTTQQNILDSSFGLALAIKNARTILAISYNGTSWANQYTGNLVIEPNTTYVYRISWNGIQYKIQYFNGAEYVNDFAFASTQQPYPKQMFIGVSKLSDNYFEGSINLNYANLKVDNNVVWTGMDDAGISSRLAIDLSNIDSAGEQKIKEIAGGGDCTLPIWNVSTYNNGISKYTEQEIEDLKNILNKMIENNQITPILINSPYSSYSTPHGQTILLCGTDFISRVKGDYSTTSVKYQGLRDGLMDGSYLASKTQCISFTFGLAIENHIVSQITSITYNLSNLEYLAKNNTSSFTPTGNYNPATKKYVDDSIDAKIGRIQQILDTLVSVSEE